MSMKKVVSIIMVSLLLLTALTGCDKSGDKKNTELLNNATATGRYMEEEVKLPEGMDSSQYITLTKNPEGGIELYIKNNGLYEKYTYVDKEWVKANEDDVQKYFNPDSVYLKITDVFYGEDGVQYILGENLKGYNELYKRSENGEYEKIAINKFEEEYEDWGIPSKPNYIKVLENGLISAIYPSGEIEIYSPDGQTVVSSFDGGTSKYGRIDVDGNILYYLNQSGNELHRIDLGSEEQEESKAIDIKLTDKSLLEVKDGVTYLCDSTGIRLYKQGGSIWETIVDDNQTSLSMPLFSVTKFIIGTQDDYYCVMKDEASVMIKHYFYDKNVNTMPSIELSIFSIKESNTIRQAIAIFRNSHPEVKINYQVANSDQEESYTYGVSNPEEMVSLTDYVNAFNTELLAKKGADILVLDDLPIDSYIEKGVLEDMGSIFTPMLEAGDLMGNIAENYSKDGKVYVMPARFKVPVIYGCADAVNATDTLEKLTDYVLKNNEIPLLAESNYRALAAWFLLTYFNQIVDDKNVIDEGLLEKFLEDINTLSVNINASDDAELGKNNNMNGVRQIGYWVEAVNGVYKKLLQTNMEEMGSIGDFAIPLVATKHWNGSYKAINNTFKANLLVGINSSGKHKDLAKEFIQLLFSKDIQSLELSDGFPINKAAMEEWTKYEYNIVYFYGSNDDYIRADYPRPAVRNKIYDNLCALTNPMINDTVLVNMILDEVERYLRGDITVDQATKNVQSRINRYLSE